MPPLATTLIDAETRERIDVLPDWGADTLETWLREHPVVQIVCRDGSGAYAEAIRRALPGAVHCVDRRHIWHNMMEAVHKEVAAHSACWAAAGPPIREGKRAATNQERWYQIHDLLDKGVGLGRDSSGPMGRCWPQSGGGCRLLGYPRAGDWRRTWWRVCQLR